MAESCKLEACVQKAEYEERLRVQKEECEERLRMQREEGEEKLRVQKKEHKEAMVTQMKEIEERLTRDITSTCEQRLRVQKDECDELLLVQKGEHERAILVQQDATVKYYGYYPLPLEDFPLEIIALIADFVHDFGDLANMALVSRRVHNGVLLSHQWIVVEEIFVATNGKYFNISKSHFDSRLKCADYACRKGLLRCLRALNLSRDEVTRNNCRLVTYRACQYGQLDVLKYLHTTYALTAQEFSVDYRSESPITYAAKHLPVLKYLHSVMGFVVQQWLSLCDAAHCLETLKFLHSSSDVDFLANRERQIDYLVVQYAAHSTPGRDNCGGTSCGGCGACAHERLVYLRDMYGITKEVAHEATTSFDCRQGEKESIREAFDLEG